MIVRPVARYFGSTAQMSPLAEEEATLNDVKMMFFLPASHLLLYSDTSANEDNSFRNHIR